MCSPHANRHWVHEEPVFIRRRHGMGFGPGGRGGFGGPFGPGGFAFGPGPRGRGRRRRGDVRLAMLMLLKVDGPRNGYQLMQGLEERSEGRWRPSPGSVYPALAQLEDEGFVRSVQGDSGRTFEITEAGAEYLQERDEQRAPWEPDEDEGPDDARRALRHAIGQAAAAAWQVGQTGDPAQTARATEILDEARRALYRLLAGDAPSDADE